MLTRVELQHYPIGITTIILVIFIVLFLKHMFNKIITRETLIKTHKVSGYYLSLAGTFYAVLLGFVVVDALSKFEYAQKTVEAEAASLLNIYSMAEQFPKESPLIKSLIKDYVDEIINYELPNMESEQMSPKAMSYQLALIRVIRGIEPKKENQTTIYSNLINEIYTVWRDRRDRVRNLNFGLPTAEWIVLILGAIITVFFTFFFFSEAEGIHLLMIAMTTLLISMSLYLILLFGSPFSGDLRVSDQPFRSVKKIITEFL